MDGELSSLERALKGDNSVLPQLIMARMRAGRTLYDLAPKILERLDAGDNAVCETLDQILCSRQFCGPSTHEAIARMTNQGKTIPTAYLCALRYLAGGLLLSRAEDREMQREIISEAVISCPRNDLTATYLIVRNLGSIADMNHYASVWTKIEKNVGKNLLARAKEEQSIPIEMRTILCVQYTTIYVSGGDTMSERDRQAISQSEERKKSTGEEIRQFLFGNLLPELNKKNASFVDFMFTVSNGWSNPHGEERSPYHTRPLQMELTVGNDRPSQIKVDFYRGQRFGATYTGVSNKANDLFLADRAFYA